MRVLIIGASRGIGLETSRQMQEAGHTVRALSRSPIEHERSHPNFEQVRGDALNSQDINAALRGVDAVISSLGINLTALFQPVHLFSDATRILLAAMTGHGIKRLICVTGFGAGDSHERIGCLQRIPFNILFGRAYADKSQQEQLIKESSLDWTIVRPGVLTNGRRTGRYKILNEPFQWRNGIISRANVADFIVRQIDDPTFVHQAPVVIQ